MRPTQDPEIAYERRLAALEDRLARLERPTPTSIAFNGPRSDLPSGWGVRVRIGLLEDGTSYSVERFTAAGVKTIL